MADVPNRDILLATATRLFRQRGYDGVGLAELLKASGLPKGSLYYHFPGGKRALAAAATLSAGAMVEGVIDRVLTDAVDFASGGASLCRAIAEMVGRQDHVLACPVASILQAGAQEPDLRQAGRKVLTNWIARLERHADRLGHPQPSAAAELLVMQIEGAWMMALAEQDGAPLARLATWLDRRGGPEAS